MQNDTEIKSLLETFRTHWREGYREAITEPQLMGVMLAYYFKWNGLAILEATYEALEDSNFHTDNKEIAKLITKYKTI